MSNSPWIESFAPVIAAIEQAAYQRGWNDALASMALPSIATEPEPVEITDLDDIQVMAEPPPPKPRKPRQYVPVKDMIGESFTLAELLDSLQGHAKKFKMMRRSDPASAEIFETFGCAIVANKHES